MSCHASCVGMHCILVQRFLQSSYPLCHTLCQITTHPKLLGRFSSYHWLAAGSGHHGDEADTDAATDKRAEAHQQLADTSDEPSTPVNRHVDSDTSRTGTQQPDFNTTDLESTDSQRGQQSTVRKRKSNV